MSVSDVVIRVEGLGTGFHPSFPDTTHTTSGVSNSQTPHDLHPHPQAAAPFSPASTPVPASSALEHRPLVLPRLPERPGSDPLTTTRLSRLRQCTEPRPNSTRRSPLPVRSARNQRVEPPPQWRALDAANHRLRRNRQLGVPRGAPGGADARGSRLPSPPGSAHLPVSAAAPQGAALGRAGDHAPQPAKPRPHPASSAVPGATGGVAQPGGAEPADESR